MAANAWSGVMSVLRRAVLITKRYALYYVLCAAMIFMPMTCEVAGIGSTPEWYRNYNLSLNCAVYLGPSSQLDHVDVWAGWPFICLRGQVPGSIRFLWIPALANVAMFAVILASLATLVGTLRRQLRLEFGRCPTCSYPISESDRCSECGRSRSMSVWKA